MSKDWLENLTDEYFLEVGKAVTEWGELETLIYSYLKKYLHNEAAYNLISQNFRNFDKRCDLVLTLAKENAKDSADDSRLKDALKNAKKLSDERNEIAHNPMKFWIDENRNEITGGIMHSRTGKHTTLNLEAVKNFSQKAHELRFEIMNGALDLERA